MLGTYDFLCNRYVCGILSVVAPKFFETLLILRYIFLNAFCDADDQQKI